MSKSFLFIARIKWGPDRNQRILREQADGLCRKWIAKQLMRKIVEHYYTTWNISLMFTVYFCQHTYSLMLTWHLYLMHMTAEQRCFQPSCFLLQSWSGNQSCESYYTRCIHPVSIIYLISNYLKMAQIQCIWSQAVGFSQPIIELSCALDLTLRSIQHTRLNTRFLVT